MYQDVKSGRTPFHEFEVGFNIISDLIEPATRVLDLGCGSGTLLQRLRDEKDVEGCGVELDRNKVIRCIERGIRVMTLDLDEGLEAFPDLSYEYVVLSRTLQQLVYPDRLVREMLRVGSKAIITFPNSGHWKPVVSQVLSGRTKPWYSQPNPWYATADIHRITVKDFHDFIHHVGGKIQKEIFILNNKPVTNPVWANRRAQWDCCLIAKA